VEFRQKAVAKAQAGVQLGPPVRLTRARTWIVLATLILVVVAGGLWVGFGGVAQTLPVSGVLAHRAGLYSIRSTAAGQVTAMLVGPGSTVAAGAPVARLTAAGGRVATVRAVAAGRVVETVAAVGESVGVGTTLARVDLSSPGGDALVAVLFVPASSATSIRPGTEVDLAVRSAPPARFGVLRARVAEVGTVTLTAAEIGQFVADQRLVGQLTTGEPPVKVVADLIASTDTVSGLAWSTKAGPPYRIDSTTPVSAAIRLGRVRPIQWLVGA
jgi:hypothetical protein